jgi:hypothetical protein
MAENGDFGGVEKLEKEKGQNEGGGILPLDKRKLGGFENMAHG